MYIPDERHDESRRQVETDIAHASYLLTEEDERELERVRNDRAVLEQRILKLDRNAHLDGLREHFPLGTGGSRYGKGTQSRKRFDASFDKAKKLTPLYGRHLRLLAQEEAIITGQRAKEREVEKKLQAEQQTNAERVRTAHSGDYVEDSAYGIVRVVRVNKQSLTIETDTGRLETRKFTLLRRVAFTKDQQFDWFLQRDTTVQLPIRTRVREVIAGNGSIEDAALWLKEETLKLYSDMPKNLPWQEIVHAVYEKEHQRFARLIRYRALGHEWVTEENDQQYAWEQIVMDWLLQYRPRCIATDQLDDDSIQTALQECDILLLRRKRS